MMALPHINSRPGCNCAVSSLDASSILPCLISETFYHAHLVQYLSIGHITFTNIPGGTLELWRFQYCNVNPLLILYRWIKFGSKTYYD